MRLGSVGRGRRVCDWRVGESTTEERCRAPTFTSSHNRRRRPDGPGDVACGMTVLGQRTRRRRSSPRVHAGEVAWPPDHRLGGTRPSAPGPDTRTPDRPRVVVIGPNSAPVGEDRGSKEVRGREPLSESLGALGMRLFSVGLGLGIGALVLWASNVHGPAGDPSAILRAGGRIAGVFAGFLLLTQVLLMSRLRWLNRRVGTADLQAVHREIGSLLTLAVLLHVSLAIEGSALAHHVSPLAQLGTILTLPDMMSALVGTGVLFGVGLSAIRIVRAAMPFEVWHAVHMSSYAALVLTFAHQFSAGTELRHAGVARTVWAGCYVTVLALWVWGRVIAPWRFNLRHRLRVSEVVAEGPHTYSIYLTGRRLRQMRAHAGHSLRFRFLTGPYWWQSHPFSLSAAPTRECLRLTVNIVGKIHRPPQSGTARRASAVWRPLWRVHSEQTDAPTVGRHRGRKRHRASPGAP